MADKLKQIKDFTTKPDFEDEDLLLLQGQGVTYNVKGSSLKKYAQESAKPFAEAAAKSAADASASADRSETAVEHPPVIDYASGFWKVWDRAAGEYVTTEIRAVGEDFQILGYYPTVEDLEAAVPTPGPGDAYGVGAEPPYDIYVWDAVSGEWKNNGPMMATGDMTRAIYDPQGVRQDIFAYTDTRVQAALDVDVGLSMAGQQVQPAQGTTVTAGKGAEIFNDYAARTFDTSGAATAGNVASGDYSHAEGWATTASGLAAHAEGYKTTASATDAHAEGGLAKATGLYSHAEGNGTEASGMGSHSEGMWTIAEGQSSHAEGESTKATDTYAHAEGYSTTASGAGSHAEGNGTTASERRAHAEGYQTTASGQNSHAEGYAGIAEGNESHVEGGQITGKDPNKATGDAAHAEGLSTKALNQGAHAEGEQTTASGANSHAEGQLTTASASSSHAQGYMTTASGVFSHAGGNNTLAEHYAETAIGSYNVKKSPAHAYYTDDLFVVGRGMSDTTRANIFRVSYNAVYGTGTYNTSGADYAELFEWADGNPDAQDRTGRFVTLAGEKLRLAGPEDGYILGIVSGSPSVLGDVYDDQWAGMFLTDVYGRPVMEDVEVPAVIEDLPDPEDPEKTTPQEVIPAHTERRQKLNPEYDNSQRYIPRTERPEWAAVGLVGKLVALDDGSCRADGWCAVGEGGVASASAERTRFRCMARLDESHVRIMILP